MILGHVLSARYIFSLDNTSQSLHFRPQYLSYEYKRPATLVSTFSSLMEPWDGPAAVAFTDGKWLGATLDRNGLRPARYMVTTSNELILASETGVLPIKPEEVQYKGRLQPGRMLLVNLEEHRIVPDEEIKHMLAIAPALWRVAEGKPAHAGTIAAAAAGLRIRSRDCAHQDSGLLAIAMKT